MIKCIEFEGKTEQELLEKIDVEKCHYTIEEIPGKLFKGKKYILRAIEKEAVREFIKEFINNFSKALDKKVNLEIRYNDDCYNIMLVCDDNAVIIGKDGKTLKSIQLLLHQIINNLTGFSIRINVDAGNYKANRERNLEREIKSIARDVLSSKIEVKLDPMNSYERRIVHNIVGKFDKLSSESIGEEPTRYVVISYKED